MSMRKCPLCGNNTINVIKNFKFEGNYILNKLPENIDIVICDNCLLVYNDMISSQSEFDNYYRNLSIYNQNFCALNYQDNVFYKKIFNILKKYINKNDFILDIGCGNGLFLTLFYESGFNNLYGIDQSNAFYHTQSKYNINFVDGSIFRNNFNIKFNLITMVNVLEHIFDLDKLLFNINDIISNDGILYIDVPNIKYYNNFPNISTEHVNHFSIESITNLAKIYKYDILEINEDHFIDTQIQVILKKNNNIKNTSLLNDVLIRNEISNNYNKFINNIFNNVNYELIDVLAENQSEVILWGVANSVLPILHLLKKLNIKYIVDSDKNKKDKIILNKPIVLPSDIINSDAVILILPETYYNIIHKQIKEMGLKNKVEFLTRPDQTRPDQTRPDQN